MNDIHIRPAVYATDAEILDWFRNQYWEADLELPKGLNGPRHETAIAEKEGKVISSLTCTMAAILDPFIHNPHATPMELQKSLIKLEAAMAYNANRSGAADLYIALPNQLTDYMHIVEKTGYRRTVENCTVFRRPILPDTAQLIGPTRDRLESEKSVTVPE